MLPILLSVTLTSRSRSGVSSSARSRRAIARTLMATSRATRSRPAIRAVSARLSRSLRLHALSGTSSHCTARRRSQSDPARPHSASRRSVSIDMQIAHRAALHSGSAQSGHSGSRTSSTAIPRRSRCSSIGSLPMHRVPCSSGCETISPSGVTLFVIHSTRCALRTAESRSASLSRYRCRYSSATL